MTRPDIEELRRTPEWRAAVRRNAENAVAAGLPRYVQDDRVLDAIAAMVVASQRARKSTKQTRNGAEGRPAPAPKKESTTVHGHIRGEGGHAPSSTP